MPLHRALNHLQKWRIPWLLLIHWRFVGAATKPSPLGAVPLAVQSPYLSTWATGAQALTEGWAHFWDGTVTGWVGYAAIDDATYIIMGSGPETSYGKMPLVDAYQTASSSVFVMQTNSVNITYTFLSPVTPNDLLRASIPFAYIIVTAESRDGNPHNVVVYMDISGEWLSGTPAEQVMKWTTTPGESFVTHKLQLMQTQSLAEHVERIQDGAVYFSGMGPNLSYRIGGDHAVRGEFVANRTVTATIIDNNFRLINTDASWPIFAFSADLGSVLALSEPMVLSVGHARMSMGQIHDTPLFPYYAATYAPDDLPSFVMGDFQLATKAAVEFDAQVETAARKISDKAFEVVVLSIRQSLGATELMVKGNPDGSYDTSTPMLFVKDISRTSPAVTNPVDALYAMWPMLRYLNPSLSLAAIEPVLSFAASANPALQYAPSNIGHYPVASGQIINGSSVPNTPLEATADIIIMALDAAQQAKDATQLHKYAGIPLYLIAIPFLAQEASQFDLLDNWTKYLLDNALYPGDNDRFTADAFLPGLVNQTNLAVKGIIAIGAMSAIANMTDHYDLGVKYDSIARSYAQQWTTQVLSPGGDSHIKLQYSANASCAVSYNLYMDRLLGLYLIPLEVYAAQESFYQGQLTAYGLPLNCNTQMSSSVWNMWTASMFRDTGFRNLLIDAVAGYAELNPGSGSPFADIYSSHDGTVSQLNYRARPHVGGHLAIMIPLDLSTDAPAVTTDSPDPNSQKNSATCACCIGQAWTLLFSCVFLSIFLLK